jgi:hypothetical protein
MATTMKKSEKKVVKSNEELVVMMKKRYSWRGKFLSLFSRLFLSTFPISLFTNERNVDV